MMVHLEGAEDRRHGLGMSSSTKQSSAVPGKLNCVTRANSVFQSSLCSGLIPLQCRRPLSTRLVQERETVIFRDLEAVAMKEEYDSLKELSLKASLEI